MSYATRLAAMSRGHAPQAAPRVIGAQAEAPHEEHVETEVRAPVAAQPAPATARPPASPPPRQPVLERTERAAVPDTEDREREAPLMRREALDRHTLVEHRTIVETTASERLPRERIALPRAAQWLEDDRSAPDPLVATAETDALRELMQQVRQWTSSAPTVIEGAAQNAAGPTAPVDAPVVAAAAPSHVSIGNVVITVEDAPAARPRGAPAPSATRSTTDRMARHYIRGD